MICPSTTPYKCMDGSCKREMCDITDAGMDSPKLCPGTTGSYVCPDGSCGAIVASCKAERISGSQAGGANAGQCTSSEFPCSDGTCMPTKEGCLKNDCPVTCADGTCVRF